MKNQGLLAHRLQQNPEEQRFAEAWSKCGVLDFLLDPHHGSNGRPTAPSERDQVVAATVIQWLGSPVGQGFLRRLGWKKKSGTESDRSDSARER